VAADGQRVNAVRPHVAERHWLDWFVDASGRHAANVARPLPSGKATGGPLKTYSRNNVERAALLLLIQPRVTSSAMKQQQHAAGPSTSDFRDSRYDGAIRATLGKTLRERHDLMEPFAPRLLELLAQLNIGVHVRETTEAKLYAEVDDCVATMVQAAGRKPHEPEGR
jgi:hypothetical protein